MTWIKTISFGEATGKLKQLYRRIKGPVDHLDNILVAHSLRPHTLSGHMSLYKNVLHHRDNTLPKWYMETIGVYVSLLNGCDYCVNHHLTGLGRLLNDRHRTEQILEALQNEDLLFCFNEMEITGLEYARKLTLNMHSIQKSDLSKLRMVGFSEGEILEINQVASYFNYANRTVVGLGVNLDGDILGLSPNDSNDSDNWNHI